MLHYNDATPTICDALIFLPTIFLEIFFPFSRQVERPEWWHEDCSDCQRVWVTKREAATKCSGSRLQRHRKEYFTLDRHIWAPEKLQCGLFWSWCNIRKNIVNIVQKWRPAHVGALWHVERYEFQCAAVSLWVMNHILWSALHCALRHLQQGCAGRGRKSARRGKKLHKSTDSQTTSFLMCLWHKRWS